MTPERSEYNRQWRRNNPERVAEYAAREAARRRSDAKRQARKAYSRDYYKTAHGRAVVLVQCARKRAAQKGLPFALSVRWVEERIEAGHCEITGLPFNLNGERESWRDPWAPSLDQTVPGAGYTEQNVKVVACIYNLAKSDFSAADVERFAMALVKDKT